MSDTIETNVKLYQLKNVVFRDVNDHVSNYEVVHFKLYYFCPICGFQTVFEKDDAPYSAIKFMANYPCYNCWNVCKLGECFMVEVSPDEGIFWDPVSPYCVEEGTEIFENVQALVQYEEEHPNMKIGCA